MSGIKEQCVFNDIDSFDATKNMYLDPKHDFLDGELRYDLAAFLEYFIEKGFFTFEYLNLMLKGFQYGSNDNINKPPRLIS